MPPNNHDRDSVERRVDAIERALTEEGVTPRAELPDRIDRLDDLETRITELEAAVQALRGYVGSVRAVNEDIERRADRALRKADAIERTVAPDFPVDSDGSDEPDGTALLARFRERL